MNFSAQFTKTRYARILLLAVLLLQSFQSHTITEPTPGLTPKAQQTLYSVKSASDSLFSIKTEQTPAGATRSLTLKTLQNQYPDFDPLLSNVKTSELAKKLGTWSRSVNLAINFTADNAFGDKTLQQSITAYRGAFDFFNHIMNRYDPVKHPLDITFVLAPITGGDFKETEKAMNQARQMLNKEFGRLTLNRENKNSTRILLINLIDLLNKNIHTVRKRLFELDKELKASPQKKAQPQAPGQRPHELPAPPLAHPQLERPVIPAEKRKKPSEKPQFKDVQAEIKEEREAFYKMLQNFKTHKTFEFYKQMIDKYNPVPYKAKNQNGQFDSLIARYRNYIEEIVAADQQLFQHDLERYRKAHNEQMRKEIRKRWNPQQVNMKGRVEQGLDTPYEATRERYINYQEQFDKVAWEKLGVNVKEEERKMRGNK